MELAVESDIYTPSISNEGNYIDIIPSFNNIKYGLICPCGSRKDKKYLTNSFFASHLKSKCHQNWLINLNLNRANHYIENKELVEILKNQRIIIGSMEKKINQKNVTIDLLMNQINQLKLNNNTVTNLIDF
jgi:hypothetical protein